ncbi:malonyl-ACP O-methyltransferase BioC [Coprobacter tertius]|uniref:Malonyl-[acyl-carrier protein] O-methyltransferase n=1 Tax=Coprobacter tertius TaxID=2944915 RepID=A0ABT1MHG5_9BACT|nr:malonyl-ACP O-methyltransferase BioC [Coprobacter tertius]MCP9612077.1 malonyl-ACP O-methyltransferase BioC [Coprobacter tertius]
MNTSKHRVVKSFGRFLNSYNDHAQIQIKVAEKLAEKIIGIENSERKRIFEIGCGTGLLTRKLLHFFCNCEYFAIDICPDVSKFLPDNIIFYPGDAETMTLTGLFDMIVSSSSLQWFDNPISYILRLDSSISKNGLIAFSTFGPENLHELSNSIGERALNYISLSQWQQQLSAVYDILYISEEYYTLWFSSPEEVFYHLKFTGVNGTKTTLKTREQLNRLIKNYKIKYEVNGCVPLTYHPIYIIVRKKR